MNRPIRLFVGLCAMSLLANSAAAQEPAPALKKFRLEHPPRMTRVSIAFTPDGKTLATGGHDKKIRFWDVATGMETGWVEAADEHAFVSRLAYFPDGKSLAVVQFSGNWQGTVHIWDPATKTALKVAHNEKGSIDSLAVSPDGKTLAWATNYVHFYDVAAKVETRMVKTPQHIESLVFSNDSKFLAATGYFVQLWEADSGKMFRELRADTLPMSGSQAVAFSGDGKTIATAGKDRVRLWDAATGKELQALETPDEIGAFVAMSADGRFLAAGGSGLLHVWEVATRKELHKLELGVRGLAISRDGNWLASSGYDGVVNLMEIARPAKK